MEFKNINQLKDKLRKTPNLPGCYIMRDVSGKIIYIGKAKSLRKRLQTYFHNSSSLKRNMKTSNLIKSISSFDIIVLSTEKEALLKEADLIKKHQPYYNILWKDDKNFLRIKINISGSIPTVGLCRFVMNDNAKYFGPYVNSKIAKTAIIYIEKFFGFRLVKSPKIHLKTYESMDKDLRVKFSIPELKNLNKKNKQKYLDEVAKFLNGESLELIIKLEKEMSVYASKQKYEKAANIRDLIFHLKSKVRATINVKKSSNLSDYEIKKGLQELKEQLGLKSIPIEIECFDISNISGSYSVGSMVVAKNGKLAPSKYRRYKIKSVNGIDDPKSIGELIRRRYSRLLSNSSRLPDLIIVDGGITQLRAALRELDKLNIKCIPIYGLAKKHEELIFELDGSVNSIKLNHDSFGLSILTRLRDDSHRFAINYHRTLRNKIITRSRLDEIKGIGESKKRSLLLEFGSFAKLKKASINDLLNVKGIGPKLAKELSTILKKTN